MIALVRVDSRLIHGQVVEGWLPHLGVDRILVLDAAAAASPLACQAMAIAVPPPIEVEVLAPDTVDFAPLAVSRERVLLLVRSVAEVVRAYGRGLRAPVVNLGNIHFEPGRVEVTPSVFVNHAEVRALELLEEQGARVELRALPRDPPCLLGEIAARSGAAAPR